ncbi:hypothetical protein HJC23_011135 [Cyclotella cryptica]|uniref:RWD domain-containing protein n=1 Tax=Cyclotella cryptica TaxID=29204 RepID=A0ABD3P1Z1_9STRA
MSTPLTIDDDDPLQLQRDESDSISAIFSEDFTMYSEIPSISYSINLRSAQLDDDNETENEFWPRDKGLALKVEYPSNYPEELPIFSLIYSQPKARLHKIQEIALLNHLNSVAASEKGMPCILSCFYAARDFFDHLGLGLSMLSDDCLACVLSYLASSKEDVDCVVTAIPLFQGVYKTDIVWKELCCSRWKEKWGFRRRDGEGFYVIFIFNGNNNLRQIKANIDIEVEATRQKEIHLINPTFGLTAMTSRNEIRSGQPSRSMNYVNKARMKGDDGLDTGTIVNLPFQEIFLDILTIMLRIRLITATPNIVIVSSMNAREHLVVHRTSTWGWQMQNDDFVLRSVVEEGGKFASPDQLWKDLTSIIVLQERPPDIQSRIMWREIPEDEDLKYFLSWRARDR